MRKAIIIAAGIWLYSYSIDALAQSSPEKMAMAGMLFKNGIADMKAEKYARACPALAESLNLDPRPGTLVALADCEDRAGHIATALAFYEEYLQKFASMEGEQKKKHGGRAKRAEERREILKQSVPGLRIVLPPYTPINAKVLRNEIELTSAALALELPVDPGEHVVVLRLANGTSSEKKVLLNPGDHIRLELELPALPSSSPPPPPLKVPPLLPEKIRQARQARLASLPPNKTVIAPAPPPPGPEPGNSLKILSYVTLGVGAVSVGAGAVMGVLAFKQQDIVEHNCSGDWCNPTGIQAWKDGNTLADISTGAFIAGGAAGALGWMLLLWSQDRQEESPSPKMEVKAGLLHATPSSLLIGLQGVLY